MQMSNLVKTLRLKVDGTNYTGSAATTDLTSEAVDMQGFEGARFICGFGALTSTAVTSVKAQQCDTSGGTYADLAGTAITVADDDDNQISIIDVYRPTERFLKHVVDRGTANAVIDFLIVELYGPKEIPVSETADNVISAEKHVSPAEGTA